MSWIGALQAYEVTRQIQIYATFVPLPLYTNGRGLLPKAVVLAESIKESKESLKRERVEEMSGEREGILLA